MTTIWFSKPTGRRGQHGVKHVLRNRERDWWVAVCGVRAEWVEARVRYEGEERPYMACERCAPLEASEAA